MSKENNKKNWIDSFKKVNTTNSEAVSDNNGKKTEEEIKKTADDVQTEPLIDLEKENADLKDKLLRTLAELENTRRISVEEKEKTLKFATTSIVKDLIPIMDIFYKAIDDAKDREKDEYFKSFYDGIEMTFNEFKKLFDKNKIERLFPMGEKFDPNLHEAIAHIEKDGVESGVIIEVMQPGYTLNGRVVKPAMVAVSK